MITAPLSGDLQVSPVPCLEGVMEAHYNVLRKNGHSPSEAFNETVEKLAQSLIRLVAVNGMTGKA
jgi:ketol-acid reductoisomerase